MDEAIAISIDYVLWLLSTPQHEERNMESCKGKELFWTLNFKLNNEKNNDWLTTKERNTDLNPNKFLTFLRFEAVSLTDQNPKIEPSRANVQSHLLTI